VVTWKKLASEEHGVNVSDSDRLVFCGPAGESIPDIRHISHSRFKIIIPLFASVLSLERARLRSATPGGGVEDFLKASNSHDTNLGPLVHSSACVVLTRGDHLRSMQFFAQALQSDVDEQN
jgi:hypothetical protein